MITDKQERNSPLKKLSPSMSNPHSKTGVFLASKQLIFGENKKLVPAEPQQFSFLPGGVPTGTNFG